MILAVMYTIKEIRLGIKKASKLRESTCPGRGTKKKKPESPTGIEHMTFRTLIGQLFPLFLSLLRACNLPHFLYLSPKGYFDVVDPNSLQGTCHRELSKYDLRSLKFFFIPRSRHVDSIFY